MNISVKNKTLLFVSIVALFFSFVLLFMLSVQQQDKILSEEQKYYDSIRELYTKVNYKNKILYQNRIQANLNSAGVKEAFFTHDREKLFRLSLGRWKVLSNENMDLEVMQFHLPDGSSFLRMHNPDKFGDEVSHNRDMLKEIHSLHNSLAGFEWCKDRLAYRIVEPVFYLDRYIGALEFGLSPHYILNQIHYFNKIEGVLYVKEGNEYKIKHDVLSDRTLLDYLPEDYDFEKFRRIEINYGMVYTVYSFDIPSYNGENIAKIVFFKDSTIQAKEFKEAFWKIVFLLFSSLGLMLLVINIGFNKYIKSLENRFNHVNEYKQLIDENVITSSTDLNGIIVDVSQAFCEMCGYSREELIGSSHSIIRHPDMSEDYYEKMWKTIRYKNVWNDEIKNRKKNGDYYWVQVKIKPKIKKGEVVGYDAVMHDITDKKINEALMVRDPLTNIYNRRHFNDVFPRLIQNVKRNGGYLSFLLLDVDFFKQYNDHYGHQAGDNVLINIASVLQEALNRGDDFCFRLGGEEFGVLYNSANEQDAYLFAQKIRKNILELKMKHEYGVEDGVISASFGLVTINSDDTLEFDEIYSMADHYLYEAKEGGRNKIVAKIV